MKVILLENLSKIGSIGEAIDDIMRLGMAHPMGPLRLADLIGLDVCLDIMMVLFKGFYDSKYRPCALLEDMVKDGLLGKKIKTLNQISETFT